MNTQEITVVLGASPQKERYSYLAFQTLASQGRPFVLVNPRYQEIEGHPVVSRLADITDPVATVSMYLAPERQEAIEAELVALKPGRVIFNPGAENPALAQRLETAGIPTLEACTLVLLRTGQF